MARCCGGSSCACSIQAGPHIVMEGTGAPGDPFVVTGDVALTVSDTPSIDLSLSGPGTEEVPWNLSGRLASTSTLNDMGDVNATPTNGQVLAWNSSLLEWRAVNPTTAAVGSVSTDASLSGDGSAGSPLQVREDPDRLLASTTAGLGLSNTGVNSTVRHFADAAARTSANPSPILNSVSVLDSAPGKLDFWDGVAWSSAGTFLLAMQGPELYAMSGPYTGVERVTMWVANVLTVTDDVGFFDVITATDLSGRAGVLTATVTPTTGGEDLGTVVPWVSVIAGVSGGLRGAAYRVDDGTALPQAPIAATVIALLY